MKLLGKLIIKGQIITETGLHIGGSKAALNLGGIDGNVIKTSKGIPYIPGSSLKGKLRSLLAKKEGSLFFSSNDRKSKINAAKTRINNVKKDDPKYAEKMKEARKHLALVESFKLLDNNTYIANLFGHSADSDSQVGFSRLFVRDGFMINPEELKNRREQHLYEMEFDYTDIKMENRIDRLTGAAENKGLRQVERVPSEVGFSMELVYNVYQDFGVHLKTHLEAIDASLELLKDDYLGGQGSRGYGKVDVKIENVILKLIKNNNYSPVLDTDSFSISNIVKEVNDTFDEKGDEKPIS